MRLDRIHLPTLYARARTGFAESVANDPQLSMGELGIPWDSITPKEGCVCIRFFGVDSRSYVIETKLDLFSDDEAQIGWYSLHEDENENIVDDFLVFE